MAKDFLNDLSKATAEYMAMKAAHNATGGGISGFLLSRVMMESVSRLFKKPDKKDNEKQQSQDDDPERVGQRIGESAAEAIKRILDDYLKGRPQPNTATNAPPASQGAGGSGPRLPKPKEGQSPEDYLNSLSKEELETLRNGGKEIPTIPPKKPLTPSTGSAASQTAQAEAVEAGGAAAAARGGAGTAARAGAGAGAGGAGAAGGAAGGAAAAAGPAIAALAVTYVFYELVKAGKELAYEQEKLSRRLGEVNPIIGGQQAELDANRLFRDMATGDRLAQSNAQLVGAIDRYEKALRPFEEFGDRIKNFLASEVLGGIATTLENIDKVGSAIYDVVADIYKLPSSEQLKNAGQTGESAGFGDFMSSIYEQESRKHDEAARARQVARERLDRGQF